MAALDQYSQRFSEMLFQVFPQWKPFSSVEVDIDEQEGYLLVKIPAPVQGPVPSDLVKRNGEFLFIDTAGEITITYDYYHCHLDSLSDVPEKLDFTEAITFIQLLVSEEICVAVTMKDGQCRGSTNFRQNEQLDLSSFTDFDTVYIRSWEGNHNRIYTSATGDSPDTSS